MEVNDKDKAPYCDLPNGIDPKINYPQKFVYPSPETLPKAPPVSK